MAKKRTPKPKPTKLPLLEFNYQKGKPTSVKGRITLSLVALVFSALGWVGGKAGVTDLLREYLRTTRSSPSTTERPDAASDVGTPLRYASPLAPPSESPPQTERLEASPNTLLYLRRPSNASRRRLGT